MREPEALFWVFIFPILLAAGLGHRLPQPARRRCSRSPPSRRSWPRAAPGEAAGRARSCPPGRRAGACATARWRWWPRRDRAAAVVYRYDDTNPEGRTARMLADRAIQRAAGRVDPVASTDR